MKGPDSSSQHHRELEASRKSAVRANQRLECLERIFQNEIPTFSGGPPTQAHQGKRAPIWPTQWRVNRISVWWWCHMPPGFPCDDSETWAWQQWRPGTSIHCLLGHFVRNPSWLVSFSGFSSAVTGELEFDAMTNKECLVFCCYQGNNQASEITGGCWASLSLLMLFLFYCFLLNLGVPQHKKNGK